MSDLDFPDNIVQEFILAARRVSAFDAVVGRVLRTSDPNACVGVYANIWTPGEMGIGRPEEPLDGRYDIGIQLLIKHMSEEEARSQHSRLTKKLRTMVYRDQGLRLRLPQLRVTDPDTGVRESVQTWKVDRQRFLASDIEGTFLFLSTTEITVTAEIN